MGKLSLIRHAPSNIPAGQLAGRSDVTARMPDAARIQALRSRLPQGAQVWCSPARRCQATATALGLKPHRLRPELWEQDFGDWEGLTWQAIGEQPDYWHDPVHQTPPNGESFANLSSRVRAVLPELAKALTEGDLVVVLHAGPIRALVTAALGLPLARALNLGVDPFSLTVLQAYQGPSEPAWPVWSLERLNERL